MIALIYYFLTGLVFGVGLVVAGMSDPSKVLNFLDFAAIFSGGWDPSLAFVLSAAVSVAFIGFHWVLRWPRPLCDEKFHLPANKSVDAPLFLGAAIFGVGWGLAGFCPGPALVDLTSGANGLYGFVAAMFGGMAGGRALQKFLRQTP